jgi:hypothetical protein
MKAAPKCFGLQGNHPQGATTSTYYAAITLDNVCTASTYSF